MIITKNKPLSIVEDRFWRKKLKCRDIEVSVKTIMQILGYLEIIVVKKLAVMLPRRFALILDGWS